MTTKEHQFKAGDKVKIRLAGGVLARGTIIIKSSSFVYTQSPVEDEYGVQLDDSNRVIYYKESDLIMDDPGYVPNAVCTCGARTAHFPKDPPGHAYHCDIDNNRRILNGGK